MTNQRWFYYEASPTSDEDNVYPRDDAGDTVMVGVVDWDRFGDAREPLPNGLPVHVFVTAGTSWLTAVTLLRKVADGIERNGLPEHLLADSPDET